MSGCNAGRIHSVQSLGTVDGPGLRSVVFMQGCPLRCAFCHNPDTWAPSGGQEVEPEVLADRLLRFQPYWKNGGVTVSGGEPLMQASFVTALFERLKREDVHTALDTSGCLSGPEVERLLDVTDLVLLDYKMTNARDYEAYTRCKMERVEQFLKGLQARRKTVWLRQVVIQGINDDEENLRRLAKVVLDHDCVQKVELLPFRKLCIEKYEALGIPFPFGDKPETAEEAVNRRTNRLNQLISEGKRT